MKSTPPDVVTDSWRIWGDTSPSTPQTVNFSRTWETRIPIFVFRTIPEYLLSPPPPPALGYHDERGQREIGQSRSSMVRLGIRDRFGKDQRADSGSIQEALRMYFQPIKNDDLQLDFYTMYKRETMDYDTTYMQKYNDDLNTTLIFVRPCAICYRYIWLTAFSGWSILRGQLRLRHIRGARTRTRSQWTVGSLSPSNSPHPQPICRSRRRPRHAPGVEWPCRGDRRNLETAVCEFADVADGCIRCNAGQAMVEPVPQAHRRVYGRTLWRPPAQI